LRIDKPSTPTKRVSRNLRRERRRWDDAAQHPQAIGCTGCIEHSTCGGEHKRQHRFSCMDDCCGNPSSCDIVCPRNQLGFIERIREIDGFSLDNVPRAKAVPVTTLPSYVPVVYHPNRRAELLQAEAVALPLHKVYSRRTGLLRFTSHTELADAFRVSPDTRIVLLGCGRDKPIEAWWRLSAGRARIVAALKGLGVELISSPNYSLFTDVPRHDDLYNIKRITLAWQEIVAAGLSGALHLNARTERDYERLAEFVAERPEVTEVAFEFATGAAWPGRREFHRFHLALLAGRVGRPLTLMMIGGIASLPGLAVAFDKLTYFDTTPFMTAMHRQRLTEGNDGRLVKSLEETDIGAPIDGLFTGNIEVMRARVERIISEARRIREPLHTAPKPESPESAPSGPAAPASNPIAAR
jgi:Domain of unknown function (DUF4417)